MAAAAAAHPLTAYGLQEGDFILLEYVGHANVLHERLVVFAPAGVNIVCTLTPDDDSYEEDIFGGPSKKQKTEEFPEEFTEHSTTVHRSWLAPEAKEMVNFIQIYKRNSQSQF